MDTSGFRYCPFCGCTLLRPEAVAVDAPKCSKCKQGFYSAPHPTVAAIVVDETEDHVLLARRRFDPFKGYWDIPGGFVQSGETLEHGLRREIDEELGIEIKIECVLASYPDEYGESAIPTVNIFFLASVARGTPSARSDVTEVRWFPYDRLPSTIAFDCVRRALNDWARRRSPGREAK